MHSVGTKFSTDSYHWEIIGEDYESYVIKRDGNISTQLITKERFNEHVELGNFRIANDKWTKIIERTINA